MLFLILLALLLVPPFVIFWLSKLLTPTIRVGTGLGVGVAGSALIAFLFLQGAVENGARRLPIPAVGTTEMGRTAWASGPHEITLIMTMPEGAVTHSGPVNIDWEVRHGNDVVAQGNPIRDAERVDPALQRQADEMAERGRRLRAERGLPPLPVRPLPKTRHVPIGGFEANLGRYYTVKLASHLDPRTNPRAFVVSRNPNGLGQTLMMFFLGCGCW